MIRHDGHASDEPSDRPAARDSAGARFTLALGACSTTGFNCRRTGAPESEDAIYATSPANIASLTAWCSSNPNDPQAYNMRGSVFGKGGRYDEALADFNKAISIDPNYAQAYANRGLVYRETGKLTLALADYNKALSIDPNYADAYLGRGMVYREENKPIPALQDFNKAIAIRPDNAQAYYNRGLLYQARTSTITPSTTSPPRSGCRRSRPSPISRAA